MPYTETQLYGEVLFRSAPDVPAMRSQEVHTLKQRWQAPSRVQFKLGEAPPDWPRMRIVGIDPDEEIPDVAYDIRLDCEGIADDSPYLILGRQHALPSVGWDTTALGVYTDDPLDAKWQRGAQLEKAALTVSAEADDETFTCVTHGLVSGQLGILEFESGFGGAVSGTKYLIHRTGADTFRIADPASTKYITGVHGTDVITSNAHGQADGTPVICPILKGGAGLSTFTTYYVRDATTNTLKLAATLGGAAIDFTSDIYGYSTLVPLLPISSDGTGGTLRPIMKGMELMWITELNHTAARGCEEAEALGLTGYYHLDLQFQGLDFAKGTSKPVDRQISATAQALSIGDFTAAIIISPVMYGEKDDELQQTTTNTASLDGKVDFDLPQTALTLTYVSTQPPPTWMLGNGTLWIPTNAPAVSTIGLYGSADTIHFPAGWRLMNVNSKQLPGQPLYLTSVVIGHQRDTTPGE
jgi:hypothetical protein